MRVPPGADVAVFPVVLAVSIGAALPWLATSGRCVGAGIMVVLLMFLARRVLGSLLLSPVQIVAGGLFSLAIVGRWLYQRVADAEGGAGVTLHLTEATTVRTQFLILIGAACILAGALTAVLVTGQLNRLDRSGFRAISMPASSHRIITVGAPIPLIMVVSDYRPGRLFERALYIDTGHVGPTSVIGAAGVTLSIAMIGGLGYLWASRRSRAWVVVMMICYSVTFLGLGSRRLALIPVLFAVGMFAAHPARWTRASLLVAGFLSIYLIGLPLEFRQLSSHGIIPYFRALPAILGGQHPWAATGRNLLISFALIGQTAADAPFPLRDVAIALSPLPGGMAGWYEIAEYHRLNAYTPTAGLGELGNAGWGMTIAICLLFGVALAWLDVRCKRLMAQGRPMMGLVLVLIAVLFLLFFVQYNLRTAARMLYYAVALDIVTFVVVSGWRRTGRHSHPEASRVEDEAGSRRLPVGERDLTH